MKTGIPGPEGSIAKLVWSEANQRLTKLALELLGPDAPLARRQRAVRRLLAVPAAPQPRQHDRGRARRRSFATSSPSACSACRVALNVDFTFTPEQEELREQARAFLAEHPEPTWTRARRARLDGRLGRRRSTAAPGLGFLEEAIALRGARAARSTTDRSSRRSRSSLPALPGRPAGRGGRGRGELDARPRPARPRPRHAPTRVAIVGGDGIYELEGAERELLATTDETRPLGVVRGGEPGRRLAGLGVAAEHPRARRSSRSRSRPAASARRALELAIEHATTREQFGKPIGAYQAVSHPLATRYTELELARSLALWAAWCVAVGRRAGADRGRGGEVARRARRAVVVCETAIQAHGGIGFTWEHVLHRLYKRALWIQLRASGRASGRVAATLLDGGRIADRQSSCRDEGG